MLAAEVGALEPARRGDVDEVPRVAHRLERLGRAAFKGLVEGPGGGEALVIENDGHQRAVLGGLCRAARGDAPHHRVLYRVYRRAPRRWA